MRFLKLSYPGAIIFLVLEWLLVVATATQLGLFKAMWSGTEGNRRLLGMFSVTFSN